MKKKIFQNKEALRTSLQKIRHISGTTKTGKALDKALHIFRHDSTSGARLNQDDVAQVGISSSPPFNLKKKKLKILI